MSQVLISHMEQLHTDSLFVLRYYQASNIAKCVYPCRSSVMQHSIAKFLLFVSLPQIMLKFNP